MTKTYDEVLYVYQASVPIGTGEPSSTTTNQVTEEKEDEEMYLYDLDKKDQRRHIPPYINFNDGKSTRVR